MTVTTETCKNVYAGSGTTGPYPYTFKIWEGSDLLVVRTDAGGTDTSLVLNTDYTVTDAGSSTGGTVTLASPLLSGYTLTLVRDMDYLQSTNFVPGQAISAASLNQALDKLEHQIQQLKESSDRAFCAPLNLSGPFVLRPLPGTLIGWNSSGTGLSNYAALPPSSASTAPGPGLVPMASDLGMLDRDWIPTEENASSGAIPRARSGGALDPGWIAANIDFTGNYASLSAAVTAIGLTPKTLIVNTAAALTGDATIPATLGLKVINGGSIDRAGHSLTINGPFDAGMLQVFTGSGTVIFGLGSVAAVNPLWWQTNTTPGTTDMTAAFQAAVNAYSVVRIPAGTYLLAGQIVMPQGVKVVGESNHSTILAGTGLIDFKAGTVIYVTSTTVSPFKYDGGDSFTGLTFYYPNQSRTAATPTVYPATFTPNSASTRLYNCEWNEIQFVNSYIWINALQAHLDFRFSNLYGAPIYRGIQSDWGGGSDFFHRIYMSFYYWCQVGDAATTWIQANCTGFEFGYIDNLQVDQIYTGRLNIGMRLYLGTLGIAQGPNGRMSNIDLDNGNYGMYVEATHPSIGVTISNAMMSNIGPDIIFPPLAPTASKIVWNGGHVWNTKTYSVWMAVPSKFMVTGVNFTGYTSEAIYVSSGFTSLSACGCRFEGSGAAVPVLTSAQVNDQFLIGNNFDRAPTLNSPPASTYRHVGNTFLADGAAGG